MLTLLRWDHGSTTGKTKPISPYAFALLRSLIGTFLKATSVYGTVIVQCDLAKGQLWRRYLGT